MPNAVAEYLDKTGKVAKAKRSAFADRLREGKNPDQASANVKPYLGTDKAGRFVYGQANDEVKPGTLWAFNVMTALTGYCYWYNKKKTEQVAPIFSDRPVNLEALDPPNPRQDDKGAPIEWTPCYEWEVAAVHGPHKGLEAIYSSSALYGRRLSEQLIDLVADRAEESEAFIPVVKLTNEPYDHKTHGMLNSHQFELVAWGDMQGNIVEWVTEKPAIEDKTKPRTRQRRTRRAA